MASPKQRLGGGLHLHQELGDSSQAADNSRAEVVQEVRLIKEAVKDHLSSKPGVPLEEQAVELEVDSRRRSPPSPAAAASPSPSPPARAISW